MPIPGARLRRHRAFGRVIEVDRRVACCCQVGRRRCARRAGDWCENERAARRPAVRRRPRQRARDNCCCLHPCLAAAWLRALAAPGRDQRQLRQADLPARRRTRGCRAWPPAPSPHAAGVTDAPGSAEPTPDPRAPTSPGRLQPGDRAVAASPSARPASAALATDPPPGTVAGGLGSRPDSRCSPFRASASDDAGDADPGGWGCPGSACVTGNAFWRVRRSCGEPVAAQL